MPRAPRRCPAPDCPNLIRGTKYCADHTAVWEGSTWKPGPGWARIRAEVLERDGYRCCICGGPGADTVHHLKRKADGGLDTFDNLAAIHDRVAPHCHRTETNRQRAHRPPAPTPLRPL